MNTKSIVPVFSPRRLIRATLMWAGLAAAVSALAALLLHIRGISEASAMICAMLTCVLASASAGGCYGRGVKKGRALGGLLCGTFIYIILLTFAFIIDQSSLSAEGIIRLAAVTVIPCMLAAAVSLQGNKVSHRKLKLKK